MLTSEKKHTHVRFVEHDKGKWQYQDWYIFPGCHGGRLVQKIYHKAKLFGYSTDVGDAKAIIRNAIREDESRAQSSLH